ncbi:MAG: RNA polymerase factor sigma-54 [Planctomycetota bacterium]|nr:RNA polymerase factor sigma-54 [Planctomycetota bacterium]
MGLFVHTTSLAWLIKPPIRNPDQRGGRVRLQVSGRLEQQQTLTPQLILSMDILQLGVTDLEARIQKEFTENPALELVENPAPTGDSSTEPVDSEARRLMDIVDQWDRPMTGERRQVGSSEASDAKHEALMNTIDRPESLESFLIRQLQLLDLSPALRQACESICGNLDDRGWFIGEISDFARCINKSEPVLTRALEVVRRLDPPGVGAMNLADCLLLQLNSVVGSAEYRIIEECLDELLGNSLPKIVEKLELPLAEIQEACDVIRQLDPTPGSAFGDQGHQGIVPEIAVDEIGDKFVVRLANDRLPDLRISSACSSMLEEPQLKPEVAEYIRTRVEGARSLIQSIDLRRRTLLDIAQAVVDRQEDFFRHGPSRIHALTMQEIAETTGVHISTVSRSANGKYVQTPHGVIELRRLFTGGVAREDGGVESRESICEAIRSIIEDEDTAYPLSDTQLAKKLATQGIQIARRTVSKYRERAGIPQAKLRKRYKA